MQVGEAPITVSGTAVDGGLPRHPADEQPVELDGATVPAAVKSFRIRFAR